MPHMPGHGISFADWFKNNPQQIGNRTIPNPWLNFGQIGSDLGGLLGSRTDTVPLMLNSFPDMMPPDVYLRPQFTNQSTDFFDRPQWIQNQQPFAPPETSMVVPPPRAHDAPPSPSSMVNFLAALNTAMGQSAGYMPPTAGGVRVQIGNSQNRSGN